GEPREAALRKMGDAVLRRPLEIVARGKRLLACAGENGHPRLVVRFEVIPTAVELLVGRRMEGVHHLGSVHRHERNVISLLVANELERHGSPPYFAPGATPTDSRTSVGLVDSVSSGCWWFRDQRGSAPIHHAVDPTE